MQPIAIPATPRSRRDDLMLLSHATRVLAVWITLGVVAAQAFADEPPPRKPVTIELLRGESSPDFSGSYERVDSWLDAQHYLARREGRLVKVDAISGEALPLYDVEALAAALENHDDFDVDEARSAARRAELFTADRTGVVIERGDSLYFHRFGEEGVRKLSDDEGERRELTLSPDGSFVAFVRDNDLYSIELASGALRRLTHDGAEKLLNGVLDWVYQEEVYGRGAWRSYWWRDDGAWLAYLQIDESEVPSFVIRDEVKPHPPEEPMYYPKPGDPNPKVRLGVVAPTGGETTWIDLSRYAGGEFLIVRVGWAPDGKLWFQVQDREQTWLDLNEADPQTGAMRTLFRETTKAWVNVLDGPHWLHDGSFIWESERNGWKHLYHYQRDGTFLKPITSGEWEVRDYYGVDAAGGWAYFSGSLDTLIEDHVYRTPLSGDGVQRLTEPGFSHRAVFDPVFSGFIDTFSSVSTPTRVKLCRADGETVRVISENEVSALREYAILPAEFVEFSARDGFTLHGMIIKPPDFDPERRYPVWSYVYGGPQSPVVRNRFAARRGGDFLLNQYLAQQGIIIWACDPRSASGPAGAAWHAYKRLGETELSDLEDGVRWLVDQGWADPERIGIWGFSYGGYMTAYALTHSDVFKVGIAGGSVTDWRNYDTIYTERYMLTPRNNPEGYESSSVVKAAEMLRGKLLLSHGLMDENVHFQNIVELMYALQRSGKQFDLMVYPRNRHGITNNARHFLELRLRYILDHL